jgi:hypothetical protein
VLFVERPLCLDCIALKARKLGYMLFQLAPWLKRSDDVLAYLADADTRAASNGSRDRVSSSLVVRGAHTEQTLIFLQRTRPDLRLNRWAAEPRERTLPARAHDADRGVPSAWPEFRGLIDSCVNNAMS